jgi:hypothetical protein
MKSWISASADPCNRLIKPQPLERPGFGNVLAFILEWWRANGRTVKNNPALEIVG